MKNKNIFLVISVIVVILIFGITLLKYTTSKQLNNHYENINTETVIPTTDRAYLPANDYFQATVDILLAEVTDNADYSIKLIPQKKHKSLETQSDKTTTAEKEHINQEREPEKKNENANEQTAPPTNSIENSTTEEELTSSQQKVISAGYGVVVELDSDYYAVLTHGDGCVNGTTGGQILRDYLAEKGLFPQNVSGGWIDPNNDWYVWVAKNITKGEQS